MFIDLLSIFFIRPTSAACSRCGRCMRFRDRLARGEVMAWIYLSHALSRGGFGRVLVVFVILVVGLSISYPCSLSGRRRALVSLRHVYALQRQFGAGRGDGVDLSASRAVTRCFRSGACPFISPKGRRVRARKGGMPESGGTCWVFLLPQYLRIII